jgi:RNA polymerase sigma factor (sigma-70 family)
MPSAGDEPQPVTPVSADAIVAAVHQALLESRDAIMGFAANRIPDDLRRVVEPQDVFQDVCFEAFRRAASFPAAGPRPAKRWLLRLANNLLIDMIRAQRAAKRGGPGIGSPAAPAILRHSVLHLLRDLRLYLRTPSQSAVGHELAAIVRRAVEKLEPDYRRAVEMRYLEGQSPAQIAQAMGRTIGAVRMLCNRGLKSLREIISLSLPP